MPITQPLVNSTSLLTKAETKKILSKNFICKYNFKNKLLFS